MEVVEKKKKEEVEKKKKVPKDKAKLVGNKSSDRTLGWLVEKLGEK